MKTLLTATLGALLLAGAVAANAATDPALTYAGTNVPVTANIGPSHSNSVQPWNLNLANQTGGER